jgi:hypothetical protein
MIFYGAVLIAQLVCSILNVSPWPLMAYNFFANEPVGSTSHYRFVLIQTDGSEREVEPGKLVPIEFFKAASFVNRALLKYDGEAERAELLRNLMRQAQRRPWHSFDEVWASAPAELLRDTRRIQWVLDRTPAPNADTQLERAIIVNAEMP